MPCLFSPRLPSFLCWAVVESCLTQHGLRLASLIWAPRGFLLLAVRPGSRQRGARARCRCAGAQRGAERREGSVETTANIRKWEHRKIIDKGPYYIIDF